MSYTLFIDDRVIKDLKKVDKVWQKRILKAIKTRLIADPYIGKKLVGDLSPYYRYRVGDYRVIYEIYEQDLYITVIKIKHRKNVYH